MADITVPRRTSTLPRNRRRFTVRLSDLQTRWFEHLAQQIAEGGRPAMRANKGSYPNYGKIIDRAIAKLPEFQKFVEKERSQR